MAEPAIELVKRGKNVVLADREGRLVTVAEADAAEVLGQGTYLPASPEQVAQREQEKKYGGALGKIAAGSAAVTAGAFDAAVAVPKAITALGSAAVGAQDPLAGIHGRGLQEDLVYLAGEAQGRSGEADVRRWREGLRGVSEANPGTTIAGRVAGEALGSLGLGAVSGRAAALAGRGGAALGLGAGGRAALGYAAAGATEGALLAQGQVSEEAYLRGDREATAEKTLAGMGLGALIGGGVGLGLAGASRVFGRTGSRGSTPVDSPHVGTAASDRAIEDTAERILGEKPSPGVVQWIKRKVEAGVSKSTGVAREDLGLYARADDIREEVTAAFTDGVDDFLTKLRSVTREVWEVPAKEAQVRGNLSKQLAANPSAQVAMTDASRSMAAQVSRDLSEVAAATENKALKKYIGDLQEWSSHIDNAIEQGDATAAYVSFDRFKRAAQRKVDTMGSTIFSETNPMLRDQKQAMVDALNASQERVRNFLMDESVWGAQGTAQREANAAADRYLQRARAFEGSFTTQIGKEYGGVGGRPVLAADPAKISSYVRQFGRKEAGLKDRIFREHVENTIELSESIGRGYSLDGASAKALQDLRDSAKRVREAYVKADKTAKVVNQIDAIEEAEGNTASKALLGALVGGRTGALIGAAADVVLRPGTMLKRMAAIEQLAANVDSKVGRGLKGFFEGFSKPLLPRTSAGGVSAAAPRRLPRDLPKRVAIPSALETFRGKEKSAAVAYEKRVQELVRLSEPQTLNDRTQAALGDLPSTAPRFSADISGKAFAAIAFLRDKMPSGTLNPTVLQPARRAAPSDLEIAKFARYWTATTNPLSVFDELRSGTLTHEHVEAVRTVYPKLYEHMQTAALDSVRKAAMDGVLIPYQARLQMALLLGMGKDAEPTLDPDLMVRIAGYQQAQQQAQPPPRGKPVDVASRLRGGSEMLALNAQGARR